MLGKLIILILALITAVTAATLGSITGYWLFWVLTSAATLWFSLAARDLVRRAVG